MSSPFDVVDESFSQWKQPIVQQALSQVTYDVKGFFFIRFIYLCNDFVFKFVFHSHGCYKLQIVSTSASSLYRPLLHACAGYLSSFSPSHVRHSVHYNYPVAFYSFYLFF
jgi:hypothetical protein